MTIAIAFNCVDGIVLCTDSCESDGISKQDVRKISCYQVGTSWGVAVASAGEADLADTFTKDLPGVLGNDEFDRATILSRIRGAIASVRTSYPRSELAMLFGLFSTQTLKKPMPTCELFRNMGDSEQLGPITHFEAIGIGGHLSKFIIKNIYNRAMFVEDAVRLGTLAIAIAKENVAWCDGPIQIITHQRGGSFWASKTQKEIDVIEADYKKEDLEKALQNYWCGISKKKK